MVLEINNSDAKSTCTCNDSQTHIAQLHPDVESQIPDLFYPYSPSQWEHEYEVKTKGTTEVSESKADQMKRRKKTFF